MTEIETGYIGNTCGNFRFQAGEKVLVYGSMMEGSGRASAHACGRRVPLAEAAKDIAILEKLRLEPHHKAKLGAHDFVARQDNHDCFAAR